MKGDKHTIFVEYTKKAFEEVCTELLDTVYQECSNIEIGRKKRTAVIVGFTGANKGRILMEAHLDTVKEITKVMNGNPLEDPLEVFLFIGEFANIFSGRAATYLNNYFSEAETRLAPPAVFKGDNLVITTPHIKNMDVSFTGKYGPVNLNIGFEGV